MTREFVQFYYSTIAADKLINHYSLVMVLYGDWLTFMLNPYKLFRIRIHKYFFNVDPIKRVRILKDFYVTFLSVLRNIYFLDYPAKGWRICRIWRNLRWRRSDHKDSNPARSGQDVVLFLRRCPGQRAAKILDFLAKDI